MDLTRIDEVEVKLASLFERINTLKTENRGLKQEVYSLKANLSQARSSITDGEDIKEKYDKVARNVELLMMERELVRQKVRTAIEKIDELSAEEK